MLATSIKHAAYLQGMKKEGADKFMESYDFVYQCDEREELSHLKFEKLKKRTKKQKRKDVDVNPALFTLAPLP